MKYFILYCSFILICPSVIAKTIVTDVNKSPQKEAPSVSTTAKEPPAPSTDLEEPTKPSSDLEEPTKPSEEIAEASDDSEETPGFSIDPEEDTKELASQKGIVVTENDVASQIGIMILKQGGNAVDAAVAVGFALSVLRPDACGLGGGGFMLIYLPKIHKKISIDYREKSPLIMEDPENLNFSVKYNQVATPGTTSGLAIALQKYGTMPLSKVMQPAIQLAKEGFVVSAPLEEAIRKSTKKLQDDENAKKIFFHSDGDPYEEGDLLQQSDLAHSLTLIAKDGSKAFYRGKIAYFLSLPFKKYKNALRRSDFTQYYTAIRKPLQGSYHGYPILTMPTPSAGGITLLEFLNLAERMRLTKQTPIQRIHLLTEIAKYTNADYQKYAGDSDFTNLPIYGLISKKYARSIALKINHKRATELAHIRHGKPFEYNDKETSHFVVIDKEGTIVNNTFTLSSTFGSGIIPDYTGIVMNNSILSFNLPERKGFIKDNHANLMKPGKKMISFMTPTIILDKKDKSRAILAIGTKGGSQIVPAIGQAIISFIDNKKSLANAISEKRIYQSMRSNVLFLEKDLFSKKEKETLQKQGHILQDFIPDTALQGIAINPNTNIRYGVSDSRFAGSVRTTLPFKQSSISK